MDFLKKVILQVLQTTNGDNGNLFFISPNIRTGLFLKKYFCEQCDGGILPQFLSIDQFLETIADLKQADSLSLSLDLYTVHKKVSEKQDYLVSFLEWAQTIVNDFNEIDRNLVDNTQIFNQIRSYGTLDEWSGKKISKSKISIWKNLEAYYDLYSKILLEKKQGYQGLVYKTASQRIEYFLEQNHNTKFIFVGLNALSLAEEKIITTILDKGRGNIFWDIDRYFWEDESYEAYTFIRKYAKWDFYKHNTITFLEDHFSEKKTINIIETTGDAQQALAVTSFMNKPSTSIVLCDEQLITLLINGTGGIDQNINITMGLPLYKLHLYSFFTSLFKLLRGNKRFYYKDIRSFLSHPFLNYLEIDNNNILKKIEKDNNIYIENRSFAQFFNANTYLYAIFDTPFSLESFSVNCQNLLKELHEVLNADSEQLQKEEIVLMTEVFKKIIFVHQHIGGIKNIKDTEQVFSKLVRQLSLHLQGTPLHEIQIMGVLESRNLDFENVVLTSVNEGSMPSGERQFSFIPFEARKQFGLSTKIERNAIYAYHFFSLLQRAKNITLFYKNGTARMATLEKSRYLMLLEKFPHPNHLIKYLNIKTQISVQQESLKNIKKTEAVFQELIQIAQKGFSPSTLINYIRNPIDFYFSNVLKVKDEDTIEEILAANTYGNIVHDTLEALYKPFIGKPLLRESIGEMQKEIDNMLSLFFKKYHKNEVLRGKNYLKYHVAKHNINSFLIQELKSIEQGDTIFIVDLEKSVSVEITSQKLKIPQKAFRMKGKIDRIDKKNGVTRVIDYKTGKVEKKNLSLLEGNEIIEDYKYSKLFQVLTYVYMLKASGFDVPKNSQAGVVSFKNLNDGFISVQEKKGKNYFSIPVTNNIIDLFEDQLIELINEIFSSGSFVEKITN